jgi:hypothetical protein
VRGLCGAHIGTHGNEHADVAGQPREYCADRKAAGGGPTQEHTQREKQNDPDDGDGGVLAIQVRLGARLDCRRDFLHPLVAGGLRQNPAHGNDAVKDCHNTGCNCQPQRTVKGHEAVSEGGLCY